MSQWTASSIVIHFRVQLSQWPEVANHAVNPPTLSRDSCAYWGCDQLQQAHPKIGTETIYFGKQVSECHLSMLWYITNCLVAVWEVPDFLYEKLEVCLIYLIRNPAK